jgi:hypothetical protein
MKAVAMEWPSAYYAPRNFVFDRHVNRAECDHFGELHD